MMQCSLEGNCGLASVDINMNNVTNNGHYYFKVGGKYPDSLLGLWLSLILCAKTGIGSADAPTLILTENSLSFVLVMDIQKS